MWKGRPPVSEEKSTDSTAESSLGDNIDFTAASSYSKSDILILYNKVHSVSN
jgi:hypothetical protein